MADLSGDERDGKLVRAEQSRAEQSTTAQSRSESAADRDSAAGRAGPSLRAGLYWCGGDKKKSGIRKNTA